VLEMVSAVPTRMGQMLTSYLRVWGNCNEVIVQEAGIIVILDTSECYSNTTFLSLESNEEDEETEEEQEE
jgi:hypothetical protein